VSTRWWIFEKEIVIEKIAFIFSTGVAGGKCHNVCVLRRRGVVAVGGSDHHGGCVLDLDSYGGSRRLVYRGRSMAGKYLLSEL